MEDTRHGKCTHRWVLGEPNLSTISGICRHCGAHRTYPSTLDLYEATPDYEELDRARTIRSIGVAALGERTQV